MAKATCSGHKRFVPTCEGCQSAALKETVGFPGGRTEPEPEEETTSGAYVGGGSSESENDIPDYEPDEPDIPDPWADGKTPAEGDDTGDWKPPSEREPVSVGGMFPPKDIDETEAAMEEAGEFDPASQPVTPGEAESEFDPAAQVVEGGVSAKGEIIDPLTPGEGEPEQGPTQMSPIEMAMFMFPARLMSADIEPYIQKALALYLEDGLTPEDAVICVASEAIHAEHGIARSDQGEPEEALTPEELEAFDAGIEAAPELTGCINDYNDGFNGGMAILLAEARSFYGPDARDADAPAISLLEYLADKTAALTKVAEDS